MESEYVFSCDRVDDSEWASKDPANDDEKESDERWRGSEGERARPPCFLDDFGAAALAGERVFLLEDDPALEEDVVASFREDD